MLALPFFSCCYAAMGSIPWKEDKVERATYWGNVCWRWKLLQERVDLIFSLSGCRYVQFLSGDFLVQ